MIPLEGFWEDPANKNVIAKARNEKLWIRKLGWRKYRVLNRKKYANKKRTIRHGSYDVSFWADRDGQRFGHCTCPAGNPPLDRNGIPIYEPRSCYHIAYAYSWHLKVAKRAAIRQRAYVQKKNAQVL